MFARVELIELGKLNLLLRNGRERQCERQVYFNIMYVGIYRSIFSKGIFWTKTMLILFLLHKVYIWHFEQGRVGCNWSL